MRARKSKVVNSTPIAEPTNPVQMIGIGEVLWDVLPEGKQLGGSPLNVVYYCQREGIPSAALSCIGTDALGKEILDTMADLNLNRNFIQLSASKPTGTVDVVLSQGIPDFTIHPDVAWDEIQLSPELEKLASGLRAVAFGSLPQRSRATKQTIHRFIKAMPVESIKVFDINLRQNFHSPELIESSLKICNVLKINDEELPALSEYFSLEGTVSDQIRIIMNRYELQMVAYTKGANGSVLFTKNDESSMAAPKVKIADTIGAGDAFTGVLIAGLLQAKALKEIHQNAVAVAAQVCQNNGALLKNEENRSNESI